MKQSWKAGIRFLSCLVCMGRKKYEPSFSTPTFLYTPSMAMARATSTPVMLFAHLHAHPEKYRDTWGFFQSCLYCVEEDARVVFVIYQNRGNRRDFARVYFDSAPRGYVLISRMMQTAMASHSSSRLFAGAPGNNTGSHCRLPV